MPEITFETSVEHQPPGIGVPEVVRWKVERERRHAQRITIDCRDAKGKFGKVNGFKLDLAKGNDGYPAQEVDEICEAIMWCVLQAYLERSATQQETLEELEFKITFDQRMPDGSRKRPSTEFMFNPDQPDTNRPVGGDDGQVRGEVVTQLLDLVRALTAHLDNAHLRIIESNKGQEAVIKPLQDMMAMFANTYTAGVEMQRRAMDYMYSTKRIEEEAAASDRRQERLFKFLEKPTKIAMQQFAKYAGQKVRGAGGGIVEQVMDAANEDEEVPSSAPGEGGEPERREAKAQPVEEEIRFAAASLLGTFGALIGPQQWAKAAGILTKNEIATFAAIFEVGTDAQALEHWKRLEDGAIPLKKLLALQEILTPQQKHMFEQIGLVMDVVEERGCAPDGAMLPDPETGS